MNLPDSSFLPRSAVWGLCAVGVAALVACVGGAGGVAGQASLAPVAPAAWPSGGQDSAAQGGVQAAAVTRPAPTARMLLTPALQAGTPVYNPVDGHFYGITHQPGRRASLWRLDPDGQTVDLLLRLQGRQLGTAGAAPAPGPGREPRAVAPAAGPRQGVWLSNPLVSADGRSLFLVADLGGRFVRGLVMHVDIDPASPTHGQANTVHTFADQALPAEDGCAEPAARTGYQLAWGPAEPAGTPLLLARSRATGAPVVLPGDLPAVPDVAPGDTSACSLALLPTRSGEPAQAWDLAEAVREAAPWPGSGSSGGLGSLASGAALGAWPSAVTHAALAAGGGPQRYQVSVAPAWAGQPLALLKRDLATGQTQRLSLDLAAAALKPGPWLALGDGLALAQVARAPAGAAGARRGSVGGLIDTETPAQGLALVDQATGRIQRLVSHRAGAPVASDLVQLSDGSVWDVRLEPGRQGGAKRSVYRIDPRTLVATASHSLADSAPTAAAWPGAGGGQASIRAAAHAVAGRGQALYLSTQATGPARQAGASGRAAAHGPLRLSCLRTDLPGAVLAHAPLAPSAAVEPGQGWSANPSGPAARLVVGPTHAPVQGAVYLATVQPGADGTPDTASWHEVDRGLADDALCRRAPRVATVVQGLTDLPVTRLLATRGGALLYASRSGKLMRLDPDQGRVTPVADLRAPGAGPLQRVASLAEVAPGRLDALVQAQDARGRGLGQHVVQVAIGTTTRPQQARAGQGLDQRVSQVH